MRKYIVCIDRSHPAYLKRGKVRRHSDTGMILIEWCTWSYICTWVFKDELSGI
jgi:hypothetical protein